MIKYFYCLVALVLSSQTLFSQLCSFQVTENRAVWDTTDINNKKWVDNFSTIYTYNGQEILLESYLYNIYDGVPSNYEHNNFQYNENNNVTLLDRYRYLNSQWLSYYQKQYAYIKINNKDYVSQITEYLTNNSELLPTQKKTYTYTSVGLLDSLYFYSYINGFQLSTITKYEYNSNNKLINKIESKNYDGVFEPTLKTSYIYNEKELVIIETDSAYIQNDWVPIERLIYDYYDTNLLKSTTWQNYYDNNVYLNFKQYIEQYYENGSIDNETHYLVSTDDNNSFDISTQFKYIYDEQWNCIESYYNVWANGKFEYETKYYYLSTLNIKDNLVNTSMTNQLYPNPADDFIMLKNKNFDKAQIIDINGKVIKDNIVSNSNININNLTPGTYFLRTFIADRANYTQFVIER
jgi:hypothetical protein